MGYYNDEKIAESLKSYSEGNTFSLFKLTLENLYNSRVILEDSKFIINMFKNISNYNDKVSFLDFIMDKNISLDSLYTETNSEELNNFNEYWKNSVPQPAPLLFFIIPYLKDDELAKIFEEGKLEDISYFTNSHQLSESLIIKFFENKQYKSLISMKEFKSYFANMPSFYDKKIYPGESEEKYFSDILDVFMAEDPKLIIAYGKFQTYSFIDKSEQWLTEQLDKERRNHILLQDFFDNVFEYLPEMGKELIIARTLYRTNNLDYTMMALNKMGITDISDYKPKDFPIWIYAHDHQNKSIYRKLLRSNVDVFDHHAPSNKTFFTTILDGPGYKEKLDEVLDEQKIEKKEFIRKLLEKHVDQDGIEYSNYSLVAGCGDTRTLKLININFADLVFYKKKFDLERFESLPLKEKVNLLNDVVDRTMLAPTYMCNSSSNKYARESLQRKVVNFNLFTDNLSNYSFSNDIIEKHLDLLSQVDTKFCDYRSKYFQVALKMFERYDSGYVIKTQDIYRLFIKIVDYISTDKNLDWNALSEALSHDYVVNKKPQFSEGSMELYNYLDKVCFSHELKSSSSSEKKKLKI